MPPRNPLRDKADLGRPDHDDRPAERVQRRQGKHGYDEEEKRTQGTHLRLTGQLARPSKGRVG
jgi:hypothetical protein